VPGGRPVAHPPTWRTNAPYLTLRGRVVQIYNLAPGTHFGRLLRPAWTAVRLFASSVTTRRLLVM